MPDYEKVEILRLEPGDVLAVKLEARTTAADAMKIKVWFEDALPGHKIVLYSGGDLAVVRPEG
jgi:hypothetical protein